MVINLLPWQLHCKTMYTTTKMLLVIIEKKTYVACCTHYILKIVRAEKLRLLEMICLQFNCSTPNLVHEIELILTYQQT